MVKKVGLILFITLLATMCVAQIGGIRTFEFLEIPAHAKVAGLGGVNVSAGGDDVNMVNQNPALLHSSMDGAISLTIAPYIAGIYNTQLNYAKEFKTAGIFSLGVLYQHFGNFNGYDDSGNSEGTFNAGNYSVAISHSRKQGIFNYGASLKFAGTQLPGVSQSAILVDLGGVFNHPDQDFTVGLVIKNAGFYVQRLTNEERPLPFDVQLGASFKPEFMPFRFSLTANRLYQYDLSYFETVDPTGNGNNIFADAGAGPPSTFDKIFQHITVGSELLLGKNINLRFGYNHLIRQSLKGEQVAGAGGFSFGALVKTNKINIAYSNAIYQVGGAAHFFTIGTNFNKILKKKS